MSEEIPEKLESPAEEAGVKKKSARKRAKASEPREKEETVALKKDRADSDQTTSAASSGARNTEASEALSSEDRPSDDGNRPPLEDGETATENPSIRRISSKRMSDSKPSEPKSPDAGDSPDQIPTIVEPPASEAQGKKRRRRRRKGPGGEGDEASSSDESRQQPRPPSRIQLDSEAVTKKAWKIFLSEVSEEGLALVSDQDAKEIGRRSFRLAEIFLEEAAKRQ